MSARISEIFLIQRIQKVIFYEETKSNHKKNLAVGRGGGGGVARMIFFSFLKRIFLRG